ncbi:MAG: hypothetical protein EP330_05270 [Deltaproteobacteria bacterium]|nr:MAG: hypothetical protein EP330_05270 [Deltaproteobacteria bacterium]
MHTLLLSLLLACSSGGRTVAELEAAKGEAKPFQKWDETETRLKAALGEPDKDVDNSTTWFAKDGDTCKALTITHAAGTVGTVTLAKADGCP